MAKGGDRLPDPEPRFYRDNFSSRGGLVKADREVVKTRFEGGRKLQKFNMNCRVENLGSVMAQLTGNRIKWVEEMGFDCLFKLNGFVLPRHLCYWLCSYVDVFRRSLRTDDGKEFPLSRNQVHWVLGLPVGPSVVPTTADDPVMMKFVEDLKDKYSSEAAGGTKGICRAQIEAIVLDESVDELQFKQTFLMLALSDVLCPTTSHRLPAAMLPAVSCAMSAKQYDWCSLVLDELIHAVRNFGRRLYRDGFALGCGGCTFFLAIFYLDRLDRPPLRWGVYPRTMAWTKELLRKAESDDRLESRDYGKLSTVDAAYTERHPVEARDGLPSSSAYAMSAANVILPSGQVTVDDVVVSLLRTLQKAQPSLPVCSNRRRCSRKNPLNPTNGKKRRDVGTNSICTPSPIVEISEMDISGAGLSNVRVDISCDRSNHLASSVENVIEQTNADQNVQCPDSDCDPMNVDGVDAVVEKVTSGCLPDTISGSDFVSASPYSWLRHVEGFGVDGQTGGGTLSTLIEGGTLQNPSMLVTNLNLVGSGPEVSDLDNLNNGNISDDDGKDASDDEYPMTPNLLTGDVVEDVSLIALERSRKQRKTKGCCKITGAYIRAWHTGRKKMDTKKLSLFVEIVGGDDVSDATTMLKCKGHVVSLYECSTLFGHSSTNLSVNYVRVVAHLYEGVWEKIFSGRTRRLMLDPLFGSGVVAGAVDDVVMEQTFEKLRSTPTNKMNLIFVPVLESGSWWCATFSLSKNEIAVIDPKSVGREKQLKQIQVAIDRLLQRFLDGWKVGRFEEFDIFGVALPNGCKLSCLSGLQVLIAVKRSAWMLINQVHLEDMAKERSWLLSEDLLSSENEAKDEVLCMLQTQMNYRM